MSRRQKTSCPSGKWTQQLHQWWRRDATLSTLFFEGFRWTSSSVDNTLGNCRWPSWMGTWSSLGVDQLSMTRSDGVNTTVFSHCWFSKRTTEAAYVADGYQPTNKLNSPYLFTTCDDGWAYGDHNSGRKAWADFILYIISLINKSHIFDQFQTPLRPQPESCWIAHTEFSKPTNGFPSDKCWHLL